MRASLSRLYRWGLQPLLVLAVLVGGFVVARQMARGRERPAAGDRAPSAPLVRVAPLEPGTAPVQVRGHGTVQPEVRVSIVPQVAGRVVWVHPGLRPGGTFAADEDLLRVEAADFELAVRRAEAELATALANLELDEAEAEAAIEEWAELHGGDGAPPPLVAREPQLARSRAAAQAADASLAKARLDLERTRIHLPFPGRVLSENVDLGQYVVVGQTLAEAYATDVFEVRVPVEESELHWLRFPGRAGAPANGSPANGAVARADAGPSRATLRNLGDPTMPPFEGTLSRIEGRLEPESRMATVVIEVPSRDGLRLLPGAFVEVTLEGGELEDVAVVPRAARRVGGNLWLEQDGVLTVFRPEVVREQGEELLVRGLPPGARLVTSDLEAVVDGMAVRTPEEPR